MLTMEPTRQPTPPPPDGVPCTPIVGSTHPPVEVLRDYHAAILDNTTTPRLAPEVLAYLLQVSWCARPAWVVDPPVVHDKLFYRSLVRAIVGVGW
jgi:hypothetical protein